MIIVLLAKLANQRTATISLALKMCPTPALITMKLLLVDVDVILIRLVYYFDFFYLNNFQLVKAVSAGGVHPCTYVSEGINVCIVEPGQVSKEENCWTLDKCSNPEARQIKLFERDGTEESIPVETSAAFNTGLITGILYLSLFVVN